MEHSKRIITIAEMVTPCGTVADIGCDHCYALIYLIERGICQKGIGCDIKKGPIEKAKENLKKNRLSDTIQLRIGNGLEPLSEGEAEAVIIAGMGGHLINDILNADKDFTRSIPELVLCPHLDTDAVRLNLHALGFRIVDEAMVLDNDKYYTILKAAAGAERYDNPLFYTYGKALIDKKDKTLKEYIEHKQSYNKRIAEKLQASQSAASGQKLSEIEQANNEMSEVLSWL